MADIVVPGPVSGRRYGFTIAGDAPTVDEQMRIDASIRQQEDQFADEFATKYGERPAGAEAGFLDYLGEFPKGVARGAVGLGETAALGIASLLPEDYETPTREAIRRGAYALKPEVDIGLEETVSGKFGEAVGSFVPLLGASVLPGGAVVAGGLAVGAGAGEASERARAAGATPEERAQTLLPGAAVGALELLPIKFMKALGRDGTMSLTRRLARIAESAGVEGAQEAAAEVAQNLIAQGVYNPEQGTFTGTGESLGYGAGVGALVQGLLDLAVPGRPRGGVGAEPEAEPLLLPPPSPEEVQDAAPTDLPDPAADITPAVLDQLGVPKGAPVYKRMPGVADRESQLTELEQFADTTKDRRLEGRIRTYVEQARAADLQRVQPELPEFEPERTGDGVPSAGEPRVDAAEGAGAPDAGGLDVRGEPAGPAVGAAGEQRPALTEAEALDRAAREAEPTPEPTPEPSATELKDARKAVREYVKAAEGLRATKTDIEKIAARVARTGDTVEEAAADVLARAELEGRTGPRRAEPEDEAIPGFDEMPDETAVQRQVDISSEEIESRVAEVPEPAPQAAPAVEPEPEPAGLTTAEMARNTIPGRATGTAGQVIPEGITPVPGREPQPRSADPYVGLEFDIEASRVVERQRREDTAQNRRDNESLQGQLDAWWRTNTSPDLQSAVSDMVDTSRDMTSVADKRLVLQLLNTRFTKRDKTSANKAWAAYTYFSKHPNLMTSLDAMAHDAVAGGKATKLTQEQRKEMGPGLVEYYEQTGSTWAAPALEWVQTNLSSDANVLARARKRFYTPLANSALQRELAASKRQEKRVQARKEYDEWLATQGIALDDTRPAAYPLRETATPLRKGEIETLDTDFDALFSPIAALDMPMHPQVRAAFMRGDINAALDGIIATAGSVEASKLAAKLRPFVQNVTLRSFSPEQMAQVNEVLGDGTRKSRAGAYIFRYSDAEMQATEQYAPRRAAMRRELGGSVILNNQTGFTPSTFLHELIHVATIATLDNKAHPLTKQVESLLAKAQEIIPKGENGLLNKYEFVSEAMTNPAFIRELAKIDVGLGKDKATLRQRLMNALRNFLRQIRLLPQKKINSVKQEVDNLFDDLLAPEPTERGAGSLYEAAFRPDGYRDAMNSMAKRVKEFTPKDGQGIRRLARTAARSVPKGKEVKEFAIRASAPLMFVAETAQRYMPSAFKVYETVMAHGAQQYRMSQRVDETLLEIQGWAKENRDKVDLFNQVRFMATELRMDPRKPKSEYNQFQLTYDVLDAQGDFVERKTLSFATREARAAAYKRLRDNPDPTRTPPKNSYDPETDDNKERLVQFGRLQTMYNQLGSKGQAALSRTFDLPEYFRNEMKRVVQLRLDKMFDGQRTMQERVYKNVFEKIFADMLIDPYQALQRRGSFGLSYVGRDPATNEVKVFKHAFESTQERDAAAGKLQRLGPEAGISQITPYDVDKVAQMQSRPSLEFITAVLNRIEAKGQLASKDLQKEFLDLVFEATPESSFFRAYQQRRDVPGYEGDITPLDERLSVGDTMDNIRRNGMHLAAKVADTEYQVALDKLRNDLAKEKVVFEQDVNMREPDPVVRNANSEEAGVYLNILNDFTRAPFRERANWSRTLTAGGYALTLGFNVSTAAMTFFQMPTIIYPYLAGKYGPRMSMQSIGIATRLLTASGRERTIERIAPGGQLEQVRREVGWYDFSVSNLDFTDPKNAYLQNLRDVADQAGVFNRSLTQEILDETGAKGWVQKTAAYSGLMQHHTERLMRESTLLSTYLMELHRNIPQAKDMPFKSFVKALQRGAVRVPDSVGQKAARDAVYTSDMTNGSVLAAAAPIVSQTDLGSVIYLFKRFPLSMLNMLWHTMKRAASSSNDPTDRRVAAMQFAGVSGSMAMFAGASGLPMFHTVAALYNLFKDDEDEDFETMIRTGVLGEVGLTGLVDYYAGVSVSSRIGLSGVFYRPGFNTENQTALATLLEGFGGPVVGLFTKYTDRVPYFFTEGEYYRMTEAIMPTAIGNAMKSVRFYTEGARTLRYDPILDEVGPLAAGAQFFGFMPTEYARQLAQNSYLRGVDNAINRRRTKLLSRRYKAYRMGDMIELREVMRDIAEFNREHPQARIGQDTLDRSLKSHKDTTSRMHHGITYSRKNEAMLIQRAEDFGNATAYAQ